MTPTHLFLDLEDTLIEPLWDGLFTLKEQGIAKAKELIREHHVDSVSLFSLAIQTSHSRDMLIKTGHAQELENALGIKFNLIPTCDDMVHAVCRSLKLNPANTSFSDVCDFLGKDGMFKHFVLCLKNDPHKSFILLDDSVDNSVTTLQNHTIIRTIRF